MDVRSSEAKRLAQKFEAGRMQNIPQGLRDVSTNQIYCRSNHNRLLRLDVDLMQYNVLSEDRTTFVLVRGLPLCEHVDESRAPDREDLLPPLTRWQRTQDALMPRVGTMLIGIGSLTLCNAGLSLVARHITGPAAFFSKPPPRADRCALGARLPCCMRAHMQPLRGACAISTWLMMTIRPA